MTSLLQPSLTTQCWCPDVPLGSLMCGRVSDALMCRLMWWRLATKKQTNQLGPQITWWVALSHVCPP